MGHPLMSNPNSPGRHLRGRVSVSLLVGVAGVVGVAFAAAGLVGGPQGLGIGIGGAVVAVFFGTGLAIMSAALKFHPRAALLLALMTYVLQMALVTLVFVAMDRGGLFGDVVDATWLTVSVAVSTVLVTAGLMWWAARIRVPIYDLEHRSSSAPPSAAAPSASTPAGPTTAAATPRAAMGSRAEPASSVEEATAR